MRKEAGGPETVWGGGALSSEDGGFGAPGSGLDRRLGVGGRQGDRWAEC